jgi:hypothetical protein
MFPRKPLITMTNMTDVKTISQKLVKRTAREGSVASARAIPTSANLAPNVLAIQLLFEF